jgi:hypothetical protein
MSIALERSSVVQSNQLQKKLHILMNALDCTRIGFPDDVSLYIIVNHKA